MNEDMLKAQKDALAFLKDHRAGVLATVSQDGAAHASTVYYVADEYFNVYFLTLIDSHKFKNLAANPKVAFTISEETVPQTLQIEGVAIDISQDEEAKSKKDDLFAVLNNNPWFYAPITKLDPAMSVVVWIRPTWARWSDYAFEEAGSQHVLKEIPLP